MVIAIIGVIVALSLSAIGYARLKARDAKRLGDFNALSQALEMYLSANGTYPVWSSGGCTSDGTSNPLSTALVPTYIGSLPKDPLLNQYCYYYKTDSTGSQYKLAAYLEGDSTKSASDGDTASNYYEKFASAGLQTSQLNLTNTTLNTIMANQAAVGDTTIVRYWKFDDGAGTTATDSSAYNQPGTLCQSGTCPLQGPTWQTSGCISGNCLSFDGVNDYVDYGGAVGLTGKDFTVEAWVKPSAFGVAPNIMVDYASYRLAVSVGTTDPRPNFLVYDTTYRTVYSSQSLSTGSWYHIVGTSTASELAIYVNGAKDSVAGGGNLSRELGARKLGDSSADWVSPFNGVIDEAKIYQRALSQCEVCEHCRVYQTKAQCNNCTNCSGQ